MFSNYGARLAVTMDEKSTNLSPCKDTKNLANMLPEELRENYESSEHKGSAVVEGLKVAAALKLWVDRGYREMGFEMSSDLGGKTFYIDVLAKDNERMVWC
mgnify:CR=1 FL=1